MKIVLGLICIIGLTAFYCTLLVFILHPKVSAEYRAYYLDRTSIDWNPPRYSASPEQGISFSARGLPTFVRYIYGFSFREPWGRWTDADHGRTAGIVLRNSMTGPLCTNFRALPADWRNYKTVIVSFGGQEKEIPFVSPDYNDYFVDFPERNSADVIDLRLPDQTTTRKSNTPDPRKLGIGIQYLRIFHGTCNDLQRQLKMVPPATKERP